MKHFKRHKDYGFFDQDIRLSKLSQLGDLLEKLNAGVDFELFRKMLETNFSKLAKGPGGSPPYDYVLMYNILHTLRNRAICTRIGGINNLSNRITCRASAT